MSRKALSNWLFCWNF